MRTVLPVVLTAQFVVPMSISGTAIALPVIAADLGSDPAPLQWVVNGFNVAFALFTVVWGAVSDRIGHRTSFRIGVMLTAAASLASALAPSLLLLDAARVLAGIGAAAVLVGSTSILSLYFHGKARATAFALFGTVNGLGFALGPTISGLLIAVLDWRGVFAAQAVVLLVAAVGTLALPALRTPTAPSTLLDFALLRNRRFLALCLVPVAGAIGFVTLLTYLPAALSAVASLTPGRAGLFMLAMTIPVLIAPLTVARSMTAFETVTPNRVILTSLGFLILGNLGMLALQPGFSLAALVVPMISLGLGFGLPIGLVDGEALAAVPPHSSGTAAGVLNLFRIGSEAVMVACYAWLLTIFVRGRVPDRTDAEAAAAGQPGFADAYAHAFTEVIALVVMTVAVTAALIVMLSRTGRSDVSSANVLSATGDPH
ncbi:MFS transporter [Rhodococcus sp. IEGM 1370]|uniref:MFS transporter n=1 Tax=unclassified Rhodococcus (in: high G+C Gram-positive bacteria) TaxID=192944 RepID=UPI0011EF4C77|nr:MULTISPECIES: MFS transporter [unclassified Rhodococcus (in: high G+C Gram-positive bacteria)]KAA0924366.1 MFS transporter [Rhodococcus sp. ANT_H53B]MDV8077024.1 MFS transporter [Rhodococcus sp. IEGM 1370]